jgi:hypothetical protein
VGVPPQAVMRKAANNIELGKRFFVFMVLLYMIDTAMVAGCPYEKRAKALRKYEHFTEA